MPVRGNDPGGPVISCCSSKVWSAKQVPPAFSSTGTLSIVGWELAEWVETSDTRGQGQRIHLQPKVLTEGD